MGTAIWISSVSGSVTVGVDTVAVGAAGAGVDDAVTAAGVVVADVVEEEVDG